MGAGSVLKTHNLLVELQDWSRGGRGQFHFFFQHISPSFRNYTVNATYIAE